MRSTKDPIDILPKEKSDRKGQFYGSFYEQSNIVFILLPNDYIQMLGKCNTADHKLPLTPIDAIYTS